MSGACVAGQALQQMLVSALALPLPSTHPTTGLRVFGPFEDREEKCAAAAEALNWINGVCVCVCVCVWKER